MAATAIMVIGCSGDICAAALVGAACTAAHLYCWALGTTLNTAASVCATSQPTAACFTAIVAAAAKGVVAVLLLPLLPQNPMVLLPSQLVSLDCNTAAGGAIASAAVVAAVAVASSTAVAVAVICPLVSGGEKSRELSLASINHGKEKDGNQLWHSKPAVSSPACS